jgi:ABC-type phosphate/phosphonate transport system substrate-binding protein
MIGHADACVTGPLGASSFANRHGVNFHTVVETISLPNLAFIVHSRVDEAQRDRWQAYLSELASNESGKEILESINVRAFVPAEDREYDPVRRFVEQLDGPWLPSAR